MIMVTTHQVLETTRDRFRLPIILCLTCKTWYLIVSSAPELWATIWLNIGKNEITSKNLYKRLGRSGSCPLDIEVDLTAYPPKERKQSFLGRLMTPSHIIEGPDWAAKLLLPYAARWNRLSILDKRRYWGDSGHLATTEENSERAHELGRMVHYFLPPDLHLPMLSYLKLRVKLSPVAISSLCVPGTPRLQSLILQRINTQISDWSISSLRELRLVYKDYDMVSSPMAFSQLMRGVQAASSKLEILHIQMVAFSNDLGREMSHFASEPIDMSKLTCLYLLGLPVVVLHQLLTQLHAPKLQKLVISGSKWSGDWRWEPIKRVFLSVDHLGVLGFKSMKNWPNREQLVENLASLAPNITKLSLWFASAPFVTQISDPSAFPHLQAVFVKDIKMRDWRGFVENRGDLLDMLAIDVGPLASYGRDYENAFGKDERDLRHIQDCVALAVFGRREGSRDEILWDSWANNMQQNFAEGSWVDSMVEEDELWQWTRPF